MGSVKDKDKLLMLDYYLANLEIALQEQNISDILICLAYLIGIIFGDINAHNSEIVWSIDIIRSNGNYLLSTIVEIRNNNIAHYTGNKIFQQFSNIFSKYYLETYELLIEKNVDPLIIEAFKWISNNLPKVQKRLDKAFIARTIRHYASLNNTTISAIIDNNRDKDPMEFALELDKKMFS